MEQVRWFSSCDVRSMRNLSRTWKSWWMIDQTSCTCDFLGTLQHHVLRSCYNIILLPRFHSSYDLSWPLDSSPKTCRKSMHRYNFAATSWSCALIAKLHSKQMERKRKNAYANGLHCTKRTTQESSCPGNSVLHPATSIFYIIIILLEIMAELTLSCFYLEFLVLSIQAFHCWHG